MVPGAKTHNYYRANRQTRLHALQERASNAHEVKADRAVATVLSRLSVELAGISIASQFSWKGLDSDITVPILVTVRREATSSPWSFVFSP